ncbi:MAG: TRAP transporter substrate-binding protein [Desulfovibrionaceae bacterium]|nr:TRAP transporter substrate-binding protein [Desulfovibrionaceae bacterium]
MKLRFIAMTLAAALALSGALVPADSLAAPKSVKVWTANGESDPCFLALRDAFKPYVDENSKGKYVVDIYPNSSLGGPDTAFQGAQFGNIQFVVDSVNNVGQFVPQFAAFDVPYLLPDKEKLDRALASDAVKELWAYGEKKGIKPLCVNLATYRGLLSVKPLARLEDVQGLKDRTSNAKFHISSMKALGMIPAPMNPSEVLTALQQGVIDTVDYEWHAYVANRIVDVAKNLLLTDHLPVLYMAYTSSEWWDGLNDADRDMFTKAIDIYHTYLDGIYADKNAKVLETMEKEYGVTITRLSPEEKARWIEAAQGALKDFPPDIVGLADKIRAAGEGK